MSTLITVSCLGQIVVLLIIFIGFVREKKINMQLKGEREQDYYSAKRKAYIELVDRLNVDFFENRQELTSRDLDFFYKEIFIYVSDDIAREFFIFNRFYQEFVRKYKFISLQEIEYSCKYMGRLISNIRDMARKEFANI